MKTHFSQDFLENSTETLRAVAHPARIAIIDLLTKSEELSVTEIYEKLELEQAVVSHHLRILKSKNVVNVKRNGKNSLYSLASEDFSDIINILIKVI